jgi:protocatechuate 3,4-dioxygenase, beta subunit
MQDRREFVRAAAAAGLSFTVPGVFAEELYRTPRQTEGPFYPNHLPLDTDNDLLVIGKSTTPAVGTIVQLSGRVLTPAGSPVRNAVVEIWQVDSNGAYLHTGSNNRDRRDRNFQGFGRFETNSRGEYRFRTIKPVPYDNRTPHIHVAVDRGGTRWLTTQMYVKGEPLNEKDGILRRVTDPKERAALLVDFMPAPKSRIGELAARFDIVLGAEPEIPGPNEMIRGVRTKRT